MQRIYEPGDLIEAQLLLGMLASEGVEAHLAGGHLLGGIGELPLMGLLGLLVEDEDAERGRDRAELGIRPGAVVRILDKAPFDGPITRWVDDVAGAGGAERAVGTGLAAHVSVEPAGTE